MKVENEAGVAVITGASSGIGRATARELASRGFSLVLTARDDEALGVVVEECEDLGADALAVPADVTDENDVREVARRAVAEYGRIDVWINNAAVYMLGKFDEIPSDAAQRLIEVNVFGYFNGGRAALRQFRKQGSGILINIGSVNSVAPQPYSSVYVASKHAIRGWSRSLRMELALQDLDDRIHVCTVLPAAIDTPIFQHAANFTGRPIRALNPAYAPEEVARAVADLIDEPEAEIIVGRAGRQLVERSTRSPRAYEASVPRLIDRDHFKEGTARKTDGNLFESIGPKTVTGGWAKSSAKAKWVAGFAGAAAVAAVAGFLARRRKKDE